MDEKRLMAYCDALRAYARALVEYFKANDLRDGTILAVKKAIALHIELCEIVDADTAWYRYTPEEIFNQHDAGEMSEGYAAYALGVDRISFRFMEAKFLSEGIMITAEEAKSLWHEFKARWNDEPAPPSHEAE